MWVLFPLLILKALCVFSPPCILSFLPKARPESVKWNNRELWRKQTSQRKDCGNSPMYKKFWPHVNHEFTLILQIPILHCELPSNFHPFHPSVIILNPFTYFLSLSACHQSPEPTGFLPQWLPPHLVQTPPLHCLAWPSSHRALNPSYAVVCWTGPGPWWAAALLLAQPRRTCIIQTLWHQRTKMRASSS